MIHLTPYRQNETSLSPVRGRGMGLCKLFDFLNLGINNKYVTFGIHKGVSGNNIPNFIASVCKASFICGLLKTKCRHIRFNHNHRSRMCICYSWLANYRLYGTPIKACKSIETISCFREIPPSWESKTHVPLPSAQLLAAQHQSVLHLFGQLYIALHILRKVVRVHRRLLRYGDFPHLALRHLLVKLIEECHSP